MGSNTYIFFRDDQKKEHFTFDPSNPECLDAAGYAYFGRTLNLLEPLIADKGLTFYVTAWTVHELPSYGPNVISCVLQDEWSRELPYKDKIGMVFRTCGTFPFTSASYGYGNVYDTAANFLSQSRAALRDGKGRLQTVISKTMGKKLAPVFNIPLGYCANDDISYVPINERDCDIYFAGSIQHWSKRKIVIRRPKELARERMANALQTLQKSAPDIIIKSKVTEGFAESIETDNKSYLEHMMQTKICPIPRGANLETYRFYEAIRYGCIPIGEAFPNEYFYRDAPIIRLRDWSEMSKVVPNMLAGNDQLEYLSKKSLDWWNDFCSERATSEFMYKQISNMY